MCSVQPLREFIRERLTAAAEEIFSQVEKTIVQYEEEIDRQRRLLDLTWRPRTGQNPAGRSRLRVSGSEELNQEHLEELIWGLLSAAEESGRFHVDAPFRSSCLDPTYLSFVLILIRLVLGRHLSAISGVK
ncbi:hypothetical protein CHARACLAT_015664 [Characodon lateralis]|uniref:Uncharacterized protein n=1 Tax=Characodon lateralis TaxID=208331 RepID=A0ABU7F5N9_9TELE|nr:hypothetical protein [Characodon lateralis]